MGITDEVETVDINSDIRVSNTCIPAINPPAMHIVVRTVVWFVMQFYHVRLLTVLMKKGLERQLFVICVTKKENGV